MASPAERRVAAPRPLAAGAAALAIAAIALAPAGAGAHAAKGSQADPFALSTKEAHVARIVVPTRAVRRPGSRAKVSSLGTLAEWGGGPVRLLVLRSAEHEGNRWLRVRLQDRPNTSAGWIRADLAIVSTTPWRVVVSLRHRTIRVLKRGRVVRRFKAVVGKPSTPTPRGLFAVAERIRQAPGSVLGPWALHLTAHSRVLRNYGGGPGRVAIHGRSGPLLADPLGTAASHGCIRADNSKVRWLAHRALEGTPVLVTR